ncbi:MAG: hypothetical protein N3A55_07765 [Methylohalobius sp.]|nr:hypothetical protein [Methylohalobius sp.]
MPDPNFDYATAFSRNLGFLSQEAQQRLREVRVAIRRLGGTGGAQVQALGAWQVGVITIA